LAAFPAPLSRIVGQQRRYVKQPPRVFVVDDRPSVLDSLEALVKSHGYDVQSVSSAAEFIAEQKSDQVGCVIIDPLMSANGQCVLQWLHQSGSLMSIVLVSGLIGSADYSRQAPRPRIAEKPHEVWALLRMVGDGLAGSLTRKAVRDRRLRG
jgi:FixJ family two-component response regulator